MNKFIFKYRFQLFTILIFIILISIIELIFYFKFENEFGKLGYSKEHLSKGRVKDSPYCVYEPITNTINLKAKYRQNNYGFRNEYDIDLLKDTNEYRIFILGASGAFGQGSMRQFIYITGQDEYPTKYTISSFLEKKLKQNYPYKNIKVLNAAVSGYALCQEYSYYMSLIRKLDPDLIILIDGYNDMCFSINNYKYRYDIVSKAWENHTYKKNFAYKTGMYLMSKSFTLFYFGKNLFTSKYKYNEKIYTEFLNKKIKINKQELKAIFNKYKNNIEKYVDDIFVLYEMFNKTADTDSINIMFCPQPLLSLKPQKTDIEKACCNYLFHWKNSVETKLASFDLYEYYLNRYDNWAESKNACYINLQRVVNDYPEQIFLDYCHLTFYGNEVVADTICNKIISEKILE
ncbi:MAG: hypothetical protein KAT68_06270 [Bacteroidales bacterium]|nr:hypothetical protein [Bacteroidales bacterium]